MTRVKSDCDSAPSETLAVAEALLRVSEKPKNWRKTLMAAGAAFGLASSLLPVAAIPADTENPVFASRSAIDIRVGRNKTSGRLEIYGTVGAKASIHRDGANLVIRLPSPQKPDLGDIRANLPVGIDAVDYRPDKRFTELTLKIKDGYEARFGRSDGGVFVQLDPSDHAKGLNAEKGKIGVDLDSAQAQSAPEADSHDGQSASSSAVAAEAVPAVPVEVAALGGGKVISFMFPKMVPAAVFRRGEAIWIVFDADVDLKLSPRIKDGHVITDVSWARQDGFTALRLIAPSSANLSVQSQGQVWRVGVGSSLEADQPSQIELNQDRSSGSVAMTARVNGAGRVVYIRDPSVGDNLAVVPALGPAKSLREARQSPHVSLLTTTQGLAFSQLASDVTFKVTGDVVEINRPGGLSLSPPQEAAAKVNPADTLAYKAGLYPSLMDPSWSQTPPEGFLPRYNALQVAAADEGSDGTEAPVSARINLARFLIGNGMYFEAQGLLDMTAKKSPKSLEDPQLRGHRAVAKIMSRRYAEAITDLTSPSLVADPAARLWQSFAESQQGHYAESLKSFQAGAAALNAFPPEWQAKIASSAAYAALKMNDLEKAEALSWLAVKNPDTPPAAKLEAYLVMAQVFEAKGEKERALGVFNAVSKATYGGVAVPASLHAARLAYDLKKATPEATLTTMDSLRFRWRGDDTELDVIQSMSEIYLSLGRYREALQVLKTASTSFRSNPKAVGLAGTLNTLFRQLFLGGMADGLQPIEALAIFKDFRDLTPVGTDGDLMVRKIVQRLVSVDLLDQAAELLEYQVNNRLDGPAKAVVATDLATIYLMDREPQKALQTLWGTRTTLLPKPIMAQRRMIEARALLELNQPDKALDILGADNSPEAEDLRAEIYMAQKDYPRAGATLEKLLGNRWKNPNALSFVEENRVLRAGVAFTLAGDQAALTRLSGHYLGYADKSTNPEAMQVVLAPIVDADMTARDYSKAGASLSAFTGWVDGMKKRFREPIPVPKESLQANAAPANPEAAKPANKAAP